MRLLLRAFPADFRRRYGAELLELVELGGRPLRDGANLLLAGLRMRMAAGSALPIVAVCAIGMSSAAVRESELLGPVAAGTAAAMLANRCRLVLAR